MTSFTPSKVFASLVSQVNSKSVAPTQIAKTDDIMISNGEKTDRLIKVTAVGEVSMPPDRCRVTVRIHSQKDNVQDVKNSIQRRLDYVLQTFQNHNVKVILKSLSNWNFHKVPTNWISALISVAALKSA